MTHRTLVGEGLAPPGPLFEGAGFCEAKDWGSVVLKEYTPSVFAYGEAPSLKEGGYFSAACGDVILRGKMTGPSGRPAPTIPYAEEGNRAAKTSKTKA